MRLIFLPGLICLTLFAGCAHRYFYLPEIDGPGAIHGRKGGIVYAIPPTGTPELTMRVRSLGIHKVKGVPMLGMRLSFVRPNGLVSTKNSREFLQLNELILHLGPEIRIQPSYVHTKAKRQRVVELSPTSNEALEIFFKLPKDGANSIETYSFEWKIHFGDGVSESQTVRFDRYDAAPQQAAEFNAEDPNYPYDQIPIEMPGWYIEQDPFWWSNMDPWWPMM